MPDIQFSVDTLRFDTVFTTQGSATRVLKIYNRENEDVFIHEIAMRNGNSSFFRLNVDGTPTESAKNVHLRANDSIYVFAEVTINPDDPLDSSPFIIEEYIEVTYQDQVNSILFEAWGQNANYLTSRDATGAISFLSCELSEITLDDPRPYIVHGILIIDSCELVIPAGTDLYVHGGIAINDLGIYNDGLITVLSHGSIRSEGTAENPVIIQGDRLEPNFENENGQWVGLRFFNESRSNTLAHTTIKNSLIGIRADSASQVQLDNCKIFNTSSSGLTAIHADVTIENSLIYNNGTNAIQLIYGGNYNLRHNTLYNDNNQDAAFVATNFICRNEACDLREEFPLNLLLENNIITGTNDDEIVFVDNADGATPTIWNVEYAYNLCRVNEILTSDLYGPLFMSCDGCINSFSVDSIFLDRENYDLRLDTTSIVIDKGISSNLLLDIDNLPRDEMPDLGCYEFR